MQYCFLAADNQRVAGVVTALKTHDTRNLIGQQIDNLALTFVTPLGADNDDVLTHIKPYLN